MLEEPQTARLEVGSVSHAIAPQQECGDAWTIESVSDGFVVAAIDGLGHGRDAARAAHRAVAAISQSAGSTPEGIMRACHRALLGTRGAAISLARVDIAAERVTWLGVGNVEGLVLNTIGPRGTNLQGESLVVRGGVVGYDLPHLQAMHLPFKLGALLVFTTDGIKQGFSNEIPVGRHPQEIAEQIMAGHDRGTDDALVLVVQHVRGGSHRTA